MVRPSLDPIWFEDLPAYLPEPAPAVAKQPPIERLHRALVNLGSGSAASTRPQAATSVPYGGNTKPSPIFARMVPLRPDRLPEVLEDWWSSNAKAGKVVVLHRLQLDRPHREGSTAQVMEGRVRRLTTLHWVPIVLEMWPMHEHFTRLTMTPQSHVFVSKRYFRVGHVVLDRLSSELIDLAGALRRGSPPSSS